MRNRNNYIKQIGNIGNDPKSETLDNGTHVTTFDVATGGGKYKDKDGNEKEARTNWTRMKLWGSLSEAAERRLKGRMKVMVEGELVNDSYEDKDGNTKYTAHVKVHSFEVIQTPNND